MLKVIGSLAFSILVSFNLSANPISFNNQENTYATVISTKGNTIPAATIDLLLKESANILKTSYTDLCDAYAKNDLTITKGSMNGLVAYTVVIGSCSLCILEDDIL